MCGDTMLRLDNIKIYEDLSEEELFNKIIKKAEKLSQTGLLTLTNERISLTTEGFLLSNTVIRELIL